MSLLLNNQTSRIALVAFSMILGSATIVSAAEQSPIDITSANTTFTALPALNFSYGTTSLSVQDTGSPDPEATIKAFVTGAPASVTVSGDTYNLLQFHFHSEAEHLINGTTSAMELHMVNRDASLNLLVVGRLIDIGAENVALKAIFDSLPTAGSPLTINSFDLSALLPSSLDSFRYAGSLTTAPYTEGVSWVVLNEHLEMSQAQVDAFRLAFPGGDSREVQSLDGRAILTDVAGFAAVPEPSAYGIIFSALTLGAVGVLRRRNAK